MLPLPSDGWLGIQVKTQMPSQLEEVLELQARVPKQLPLVAWLDLIVNLQMRLRLVGQQEGLDRAIHRLR
jgi:hypothetical protein